MGRVEEDATRRRRLFISVWICRDFKIHPRFGQFWSTFVTYMSTRPAPPLPGPRANTVLCRTSISLLPPVIDSILSTTVPVGEIDTSPSAVVGCDMWSPRDTSSLFGLEWAEGPGAPGPPGLPLPLPPLRPYLSDSYVRVYNPCQARVHPPRDPEAFVPPGVPGGFPPWAE